MVLIVRWPGLDGLRAIAAVSVLVFHLGFALPNGFIGVDVFFVLSGFLITSLLRRERSRTGRIDVRRFWTRRMIRLYPALLAMTLTVCVLGAFFGHHRQSVLAGGLATVAYAANLWEAGHDTYLFQHTWTLAIEQQFYLLWPVLFILARGRRALMIGAAVVGALILFDVSGSPALQSYDRGAGLALGCLLAWAIESPLLGRVLALVGWPALACLVAAAGGAFSSASLTAGPVTLGAVLAAPVLVAATGTGLMAQVLSGRVLGWLGARSYSLYLWHFPIVTIALNNAPASIPHGVRVACALVASLIAADVSYRYIELPFLRARDRSERVVVARSLGDEDDHRSERLPVHGQPPEQPLGDPSY